MMFMLLLHRTLSFLKVRFEMRHAPRKHFLSMPIDHEHIQSSNLPRRQKSCPPMKITVSKQHDPRSCNGVYKLADVIEFGVSCIRGKVN